MAWSDDIDLKVFVSTAGDYVALGTTTEYPFQSGGTSGFPLGWTPYLTASAALSDVNVTTADGRWSISNASTTNDQMAKYYGAYRDFPTKANHYYVILHQCRLMDGKNGKVFSNTFVRWEPYESQHYGIVFPNESDWTQVRYPFTGQSTDKGLRVILQFDYYEPVAANRTTDWGAQWTNLAIMEIPPTVPTVTWEELTCDTKGVSVRFGREKFTNRYEVASCQVTLRNDDGQYTYRPDKTLRPGRFVRVSAWRKGTTGTGNEWRQFYGLIDSIQDGYSLDGKVVTVLNCVDISSLLSNLTVGYATSDSTEQSSSSRFYWLARSAGWHPYNLSYTPGKFIQQPIKANGRTIRDEIGLIGDSEGGYVYCSPSGKLTFNDREYPTRVYQQTNVGAELLAMPYEAGETLPIVDTWPDTDDKVIICTSEIQTDWSRDRVINEVALANQGGSALVTKDYASQQKYGPRTYSRMDFLNSNSYPEYLVTRTNDIMTGYTEAVQRVNRIVFHPKGLEITEWAKGLFLNDLVRVRYQHPTEGWGYSVVCRIQGWEHGWDEEDWSVALSLDDIEAFNYWETPAGPIGWDSSLWDQGRWDETSGEGAFWSRGYVWAPVTDNPNVARWGY